MSEIVLDPVPEDILEAEACAAQTISPKLLVTAFNIQELLFEFLAKYMQFNDPAAAGFLFKSRYNIDQTKSDILMEIAHDYKASTASKRPAVFIQRKDVSIYSPLIGGVLGVDAEHSETTRMTQNRMEVQVVVIAAPLGPAEGLAEWIKQGLVLHQYTIQDSFRLRRFRVKNMSAPQKIVTDKDYFAVIISLDVAFDDGLILTREDLPLSGIGIRIFESLTGRLIQ